MTVQVHTNQLAHVQKGCLARVDQDIPSDGSRIEASHKGWNSLQWLFAGGLEVFCALGHDFVLRWNICIASTREKPRPFVKSTYGSHYVRLVDHIAKLWNSLVKRERMVTHLETLPELPVVLSKESFGLVSSKHVDTFGGFWDFTNGEDNNQIDSHGLFNSDPHELEIDPVHCLMPIATTDDTSNRIRTSSTISNVLDVNPDVDVSDVLIPSQSPILIVCCESHGT
jgi:hypothetical protein